MGKLYFRYGTVDSGKSSQLLSIWHNYEMSQKKTVMTFKPMIDHTGFICSKSGESRQVDVILRPNDNDVYAYVHQVLEKPDIILVDESHFLTAAQVDSFAEIVDVLKIPVICYGLKTNFQGNLSFEGAKRLLEMADKAEEIKAVCFYCSSKALFNMRFLRGKPIFTGDEIPIGDIDPNADKYHYKPVCRKCYKKAYGHLYETKQLSILKDLPFEEKRFFV